MKFATKLSLGCITLLSCALCAAGLILTGKSFSGSLETTRAAMQAQQAKEKYTLERCIFTAAETNTMFSTNTMVENYTLATAAQQYAEQTADANSGLALWVNGAYTLYSNLPTALPRAVQMQAVSNGADHWQLAHCAGHWYLLLSQPLDIPGVQADMLCSYDVTSVFATRNAQLRAWLAASTALLALGGAAAVLFSRLVTRPLTTLQSASEKIAAGQYTERTQVQTNDEIGVLSRSFDAMATAVETKIGEMDETLQSQKDFIAAFTHEVKTPMNCSDPYATNAQVVVVPSDKADAAKDIESIKDMTFAVESGSAGEAAAQAAGLNATAVQSQADALMEVAAGTSDACVIDLLMAGAMIGEGTSYPNLTYTVNLNEANGEEDENYVVGFRKGSDLTEAFNDFYKAAYKDGVVLSFAQKYGVQEAIVDPEA